MVWIDQPVGELVIFDLDCGLERLSGGGIFWTCIRG